MGNVTRNYDTKTGRNWPEIRPEDGGRHNFTIHNHYYGSNEDFYDFETPRSRFVVIDWTAVAALVVLFAVVGAVGYGIYFVAVLIETVVVPYLLASWYYILISMALGGAIAYQTYRLFTYLSGTDEDSDFV